MSQTGFLLQTPFIPPLLFCPFPLPPLPLLGPWSIFLVRAGAALAKFSMSLEPHRVYNIKANFLKSGDFTDNYGFLVSLEKLGTLARGGWGGVETAPLQGSGSRAGSSAPCSAWFTARLCHFPLRDLGHVA